jgi:recombination protein U
MNAGKQFEEYFRKSIPEEIYRLRIRDPVQSFSNTARFSLKNPFDYILFKHPNLFCLELKSTEQHSMSFDRIGEKSNSPPMIKSYQLEGLQSASKFDGVYAGLILNFREVAKTYYISIQDFVLFTKTTAKKSINQSDILSIPNHILIQQTKMRVNYKYNIGQFIEDCVKQFSF